MTGKAAFLKVFQKFQIGFRGPGGFLWGMAVSPPILPRAEAEVWTRSASCHTIHQIKQEEFGERKIKNPNVGAEMNCSRPSSAFRELAENDRVAVFLPMEREAGYF